MQDPDCVLSAVRTTGPIEAIDCTSAQSFINMKYTLRKMEGPLAVPEHKFVGKRRKISGIYRIVC